MFAKKVHQTGISVIKIKMLLFLLWVSVLVIQVHYRKDPHMQNSMLTKTNTNPNPDPNRYRRHCRDPNARIQKFIHYMAIAAVCDSGPLR